MRMKEEQRDQVRNTICGWERSGATLRDAIAVTSPVLNRTVRTVNFAPTAGNLANVPAGTSAIAAPACEQQSALRAVCGGTQQECARTCGVGTQREQHSGGAWLATRARSIAKKATRRITPFYGSLA